MLNHKTRSEDAGASFCGRAPRVLGAMLVACGAQVAHAQWSVTGLHPAGSGLEFILGSTFHSQSYDTHGGQSVGEALSLDLQTSRAGLWSGTAASWIDLTPPGTARASAQAVHNGQQVGWVQNGDGLDAVLWSGTAASIVNLAPAGSVFSYAQSIHGGQQGGGVSYDEIGSETAVFHAGIWHGTAESFVNLHPVSMGGNSGLEAVRDGYQVGWVEPGGDGLNRASLWNGTAESWVDLHPNNAAFSRLVDLHDGQQVGLTFDFLFRARAGLWSGTAESFVDLTPIGATQAAATGIFNGRQVGWADFDGMTRAGFWSGTAESWVDLHQFLDGSWSFSSASNIWQDGDTIYIAGTARDDDNVAHAQLWTYTIPAPGTGALFALGLYPIVRRRRRAA